MTTLFISAGYFAPAFIYLAWAAYLDHREETVRSEARLHPSCRYQYSGGER